MDKPILPKSGIYVIRHKISGKSYVGLSLDIHKRWRSHKSPKPSSTSAIHSAIRKYGISEFDFEILELCVATNLEDRERHWINELGTFKLGYNLTDGGEGGRAVSEATKKKLSIAISGKKLGPRSEEVKRKISDANKGRPVSAATRAASSIRMTGKRQSEEWRKNGAVARTGLKKSDETRKRMSESALKRPGLAEAFKNNNPMKQSEVRAKVSAAQKGRVFSPETRLKMSAAARQRPGISDETREKLSAASSNRKQSPETIAKRLLSRYGPKL